METDRAITQPDITIEAVGDRREAAYLLWGYRLSQNAAEVSRELGIPTRTVQNWVISERWPARLADERRVLAKAALMSASVALFGAIKPAIDSLINIAVGKGETISRVNHRGQVVETDYPVPHSARVMAIKELREWLALPPGAMIADADAPPVDADSRSAIERQIDRLQHDRQAAKPKGSRF